MLYVRVDSCDFYFFPSLEKIFFKKKKKKKKKKKFFILNKSKIGEM